MKYTIIKDRVDERDFKYESKKKSKPKLVDLRPQMPPVVDQGQLGSCTANAIVSGLMQYWLKKAGNSIQLSRLFLYWFERFLENTVNEDSGAMIADGMKVAQKIGVCPELDYEYDISKFTSQPDISDIVDAIDYRISSYHRVKNLEECKSALADEYPVVIGILVYDSFESAEVARTGMMPIPKQGEQQLGGHAVLVVGYDDERKLFIVRNSWSENWGDKGYFYMPYECFENGIVMDAWTGR